MDSNHRLVIWNHSGWNPMVGIQWLEYVGMVGGDDFWMLFERPMASKRCDSSVHQCPSG